MVGDTVNMVGDTVKGPYSVPNRVYAPGRA